MNNKIDLAMAEQILQGDDTDPYTIQLLGLELVAELKRCYEELDLVTAHCNGCLPTNASE